MNSSISSEQLIAMISFVQRIVLISSGVMLVISALAVVVTIIDMLQDSTPAGGRR